MPKNSDFNALQDENIDLRRRLHEARDQAYKILDGNDELRRELKKRQDLMGPKYRNPAVCSDGRVFAYPYETSREETIRWFAGQAIGTELERYASSESHRAVESSALIALDLWDHLEKTFLTERAKRAEAALAEAAAASQDETSQDETEGK